jgi:RimJ/RimL family protein N-acetyltransferase
MGDVPVLTGKRVTLLPPRAGDAEARRRLGNDPDIVRMYGGSHDRRPMSAREAEAWVQALVEHDHAWVIEAGTLIGAVRLDRVDVRERRASLAIGIENPGQLGKALGTKAIALALGSAFDVLKLHRVSVRVVAYNTRTQRAYAKCGFVVEGREREAACVDGQWHDDVLMGILEPEFRAAVEALHGRRA